MIPRYLIQLRERRQSVLGQVRLMPIHRRQDPSPRRGVPRRRGDQAGELRHRPGLIDPDQQRVAACLHQMLMRISKRRQHRQITRIDHHRTAARQVIEPIQLARHRHDLRAPHTHRPIRLPRHRMNHPGLDQAVKPQRLSRLSRHGRAPSLINSGHAAPRFRADWTALRLDVAPVPAKTTAAQTDPFARQLKSPLTRHLTRGTSPAYAAAGAPVVSHPTPPGSTALHTITQLSSVTQKGRPIYGCEELEIGRDSGAAVPDALHWLVSATASFASASSNDDMASSVAACVARL